MEVGNEVSYRLSRQDVIIEVGGAWDHFAVANNGASLQSDLILGQNLFAHVLGEPTRDFVWTMFDSVRKLNRPITQAYRCDTPDLKRYMQMIIEPEAGGHLALRHRLLSTVRIAKPVDLRAAIRGAVRTQMTFRCSCCNRLKSDDKWLDIEQSVAAAAFEPRLDQGVLRVAYTVCPECREALRKPTINGASRVSTSHYR